MELIEIFWMVEVIMAKQVIEELPADNNDRFVFLSGRLALDLVNTEAVVRGKRGDLLNAVEDLAEWWEAVNPHHTESFVVESRPPAFDSELLGAVKQLRGNLRLIFAKLVGQQALEDSELALLNRLLALGHQTLIVTP